MRLGDDYNDDDHKDDDDAHNDDPHHNDDVDEENDSEDVHATLSFSFSRVYYHTFYSFIRHINGYNSASSSTSSLCPSTQLLYSNLPFCYTHPNPTHPNPTHTNHTFPLNNIL